VGIAKNHQIFEPLSEREDRHKQASEGMMEAVRNRDNARDIRKHLKFLLYNIK
jgi:hypothetical protein